MTEQKRSRLTRPHHRMPDFVRNELFAGRLMEAYRNRPPYQQNDYIGWILRAKLQATRERRLCQMLDELRQGDPYMKMAHRPKAAGKNS